MHKFLLTALALAALSKSSLGCDLQKNIKITNYGFPDASSYPPYICQGSQNITNSAHEPTALGTGTADKPYSAAAAGNSTIFERCALIYVPILKKYFRVQDVCPRCGEFAHLNLSVFPAEQISCTESAQVNLYLIQSNKNISQLSCENKFGTLNYTGNGRHSVLLNPPPDLPTDTSLLFENGYCYNNQSDGRIFPDQDYNSECFKRRSARDFRL